MLHNMSGLIHNKSQHILLFSYVEIIHCHFLNPILEQDVFVCLSFSDFNIISSPFE